MPRKKKPTHQSFESKNEHGRFMKLTINMLESKAWQELDAYDIAAYVHFKSKLTKNKAGDFNHQNISLTYKEMETVMSWGRFKKSVDNLLRVGLIDIVRHSPHTRDATIYALSSRWHKFGEADFKQVQRVTFSRRKSEE